MAYKILIIYRSLHYPLRNSINEHLYSFKKYTNHKVYYFNALTVFKIPWYIKVVKFDLILFHTTFLAARWSPKRFKKLINKLSYLSKLNTVKAILPQDEFVYTDLLNEFINDFNINFLFTVAPETEWRKIYNKIDKKIKIEQVLTGYIDEKYIEKVNKLTQTIKTRDIDIGYRAWKSPPWLGRHGVLKVKIGEVFNKNPFLEGSNLDISCEEKDTLYGDDWIIFLLKCKYTIGVEGGASILDRIGEIRKKTEEYLFERPDATFSEIEKSCFPGEDGRINLTAISPRHLEACMTRTCQVLIEGHYNGILKPGVHYIEVKRDFSNIEEVINIIKNDKKREEIIERSYKDIVETGLYTYRKFANDIIEICLQNQLDFEEKRKNNRIFMDKIGLIYSEFLESIFKFLGKYIYFLRKSYKNFINNRNFGGQK